MTNFIQKGFSVAFIFSLITLFSCNDDASNVSPELDKDVWVENGVLHLKDQNVMDSLLISINKMTDEEQLAWESSLGFQSYNAMYDTLLDEYYEVADEVESFGDVSLLDYFIENNKSLAYFPGGIIDGLPNYSIEPLFNGSKAYLFNSLGKLIIAGNNYNQLKAAKVNECLTNRSTRAFDAWVDKCYKSYNNQYHQYRYFYNIRFTAKKKGTFGWRTYSTACYAKSNYQTNYTMKDGKRVTVNVHNLDRKPVYIDVYTRGVGLSGKCEIFLQDNL